MVQKFVVVEPKIILRSQRLYGVERDFSVRFGPRPKLNNKLKLKVNKVFSIHLEVQISMKG